MNGHDTYYITDQTNGWNVYRTLSSEVPLANSRSAIEYRQPQAFEPERGFFGDPAKARLMCHKLSQATANMTFPVLLIRTSKADDLGAKLLEEGFKKI